ncbi:MAG: class I SAM-dependent methyltransferase [Oligoflexia bacterium]|nr:class I SAM-dependent methyltransferase [Oligoflexia bacterium]
MISFLNSDPYPLLPSESHSYAQAQQHSHHVDEWLGLQSEKIEKNLSENGCALKAGHSKERQELWIGLAVKSLLTPYTEIRSMLEKLNPQAGSVVVDLGAAYGRMGFVIGRHYPDVNFVGYEFVGERVKEGRRCLEAFKYNLVKLEHADLSSPDFTPLNADYYFIYDYGNEKAVEKTLHDLRRIAQTREITVIGRGRLSRELIERRHPWLSRMKTPEHCGHISIYRT